MKTRKQDGQQERERTLATLEHEVALAIQGATRAEYDFAMNEAHALLEMGGNSPLCGGWSHKDRVCSLRLGPHAGWMHYDEKSGTWWQQSMEFPYKEVSAGEGSQACGDSRLLTLNAELKEELENARMWARHGYEIAQRSCTWSDHGVAPRWLLEHWGVEAPVRLHEAPLIPMEEPVPPSPSAVARGV